MPPAIVPDLTLHMLPHRHTALFNALYTSPHGGPVRILPLLLESGTILYEIHVPCFALYDRFSNATITTTAMTRSEWDLLHRFAQEEGLLKVILSPDRGRTNFLGKLTVDVEDVEPLGVEKTSVGVRFWWQDKEIEEGRVQARIRRALAWVREKIGDLN
jgi:hypothetical protein